ncbi:MAG: hypothetical protein KC502_07305, partial [Myxococcales bacterium]|nr:hypothetical protein [Myxococcales bacterium]
MGPAPRNQARFAALAIALTLVLSVVVSGKAAATAPVQTGCVWLGDVDEAALENALHAAWPSESIARWDAQISAKIVAIVLHLKGGGRIDVKLTNGARCSAPPVAEVAPSASRPPAPLLTAVGAVIRRVDRAGDRSERSPPLPPGSLLAVCAALVVLLAWRPSGATAAALAAALVLVVWGVGVATAELSPADRLPYPFGIAAVLLTLLLGALPKNHRREMGMPVVLVG